ncbi:peripherin-2-like [Saccostrea echinata]|uniref:peripherin-2-like n=1 Tax=Saccostrea echinata TaxID=191078 RepID=UPI002A830385|nr:peripherin-2-like [Saccostrea echinata]
MCKCELEERGRRILGLFLCLLDGILALSGAAVAALGLYLNFHLESKMQFLAGYDTGTVPSFLMIVGIAMFISGSLFSKAAFDCAYPDSRGRFQSFLIFFVAAKFVLIWVVFSASMMCFAHRSVIEESLNNGLFSVLKLYKKDLELKILIDKLQMEYLCCGSNNYEDWFKVSWVNEDFLDVEDENIKSKMQAGMYMGHDVPFSCCHIYTYRPCVHSNVTKGTRSKYTPTLNTRGCAGILMDFFESSILEPAGVFILMAFFIEILSTFLARYQQTCIDDANLMEPTGPGTACLCPNIGTGDAMKYVKREEKFKEEAE